MVGSALAPTSCLKRRAEATAEVKGGLDSERTLREKTKGDKANSVDEENKPCCQCKKKFTKRFFSNKQWKLPQSKAKCRECIDSIKRARKEAKCCVCQEVLPRESYSNNQWKRPTRTCQKCSHSSARQEKEAKELAANSVPDHTVSPAGKEIRKINRYKTLLPKNKNSIIARTHECDAENEMETQYHKQLQQREIVDNMTDQGHKQDRKCHQCKHFRGACCFSKNQWKSEDSTCKECIRSEKRRRKRTIKENSTVTDPAIIKSKLAERADILPPTQQQRQRFTFTWESKPISRADENKMVRHVVLPGYYHRLTPREIQQLAFLIDSIATEMTLPQAISLRTTRLQQKALERHIHLQRRQNDIWNMYAAEISVLEISRIVDAPPVNVFRVILAQMHFSKAQIKRCLRNPKHEFAKREQREYFAAEQSDIVSNFDHDASQERAELFELAVQRFLVSRRVAFVTQKQLESEQKKEFGKPLLTPDFLILDELIVNGQTVKWLDAKAFYGANVPLNIKRVRKQISRYIEHWGSGAIMYLYGFSEMLVMEGCTMLDARTAISTEDLGALLERIQSTYDA